jgi:hypothetical protein
MSLQGAPVTLRQTQSAFVFCIGTLISFAYEQGWELTFGDGSILPKGPDGKGRKARHALTGLPLRVEDAVHMRDGQHYKALAQDFNLFIAGKWISDGDHPAWRALGTYWKSLHMDARWGGDFGDANHFSFTSDGKA